MWQVELAEKLKGSGRRERRAILDAYAQTTGYSRPQLYRIARKHGFDTGRRRRDKGVLKSGLTDGQIEFLAALLHVTGRENKGPIMPTEMALQIAVDNGIIDQGQVSVSTVNRILRERQISKRHQTAPEPHTTMRSLHPNHTHVVDVSVCIQYYLKNGRLGFMDERDFYKNKPQNFAKVKTRLLRYVLVDHFSSAFYFKYYDTTGETQNNLYDFLKESWAPKENPKLPFRGVPLNLLMDRGSANISKSIVSMLERLDVNIPEGRPYNPRRQGAVETTHEIIEGWFEAGLRIQPATTVEELNAWAVDFAAWYNATKRHSRHGMPRSACWMQITTDQLRDLPPDDILQDLYANPEEERTVDGTYCISYRGNTYHLKHVDGLFRGAKVRAVLKPYRWPSIDVRFRDTVYEVNPIDVLPADLGGFRRNAAVIGESYRSQPETEAQKAKKRFENIAYGEKRRKDSVPFEGLRVFGHHADKVDGIAFMEKRGTPIEVDRAITERSISMVEFLKRLRGEIGRVSPELNRSLREKYGDSIDVTEADAVLRSLSGGNDSGRRAEAL